VWEGKPVRASLSRVTSLFSWENFLFNLVTGVISGTLAYVWINDSSFINIGAPLFNLMTLLGYVIVVVFVIIRRKEEGKELLIKNMLRNLTNKKIEVERQLMSKYKQILDKVSLHVRARDGYRSIVTSDVGVDAKDGESDQYINIEDYCQNLRGYFAIEDERTGKEISVKSTVTVDVLVPLSQSLFYLTMHSLTLNTLRFAEESGKVVIVIGLSGGKLKLKYKIEKYPFDIRKVIKSINHKNNEGLLSYDKVTKILGLAGAVQKLTKDSIEITIDCDTQSKEASGAVVDIKSYPEKREREK
jgi:hypothetical protein